MTSIGPISGINPAISPAAPLSDAKAAPGGAGFADTLKNALDQVDRTQQNSGAAIQDTVSGVLVDQGTVAAGSGLRNTFEGPFFFWIGASILSAALALAVWNAKKNSVARLAREAAAHGDAAKARGELT